MSTTSTLGKKAIGLVVIALLIGLVVGYGASSLLVPTPTSVAPTSTRLTGAIPIGAVKSLTGGLSSVGLQMKTAISMATDEANSWLNATGQQFTINLQVEDSATDPATALTAIQSLAAKGVKVIIGPDTTTQVSNCQGYADSNHILLLSSLSTGTSLATRGPDYIFRFAPTDVYQVQAQARLLVTYGIQQVDFIRTNTGVIDEFVGLYQKYYVDLGGTIGGEVKYEQTATDFSVQAHALNDLVTASIQKYGQQHVAIVWVGTTEVAAMLQAAKGYPALMSTLWIGNDSIAGAANVVQQSGSIAAQVVLASTIFGATQSAKYKDVVARLTAKLGGTPPQTYAIVDYDIMWLIAYTLVITQSYDPVVLQAALPQVAGSYFGASGWMALNANQDRAFGDFDIFAVLSNNSTQSQPQWVRIGAWSSTTDTVTFTTNPPPMPMS